MDSSLPERAPAGPGPPREDAHLQPPQTHQGQLKLVQQQICMHETKKPAYSMSNGRTGSALLKLHYKPLNVIIVIVIKLT